MSRYQDFLKSKAHMAMPQGFAVGSDCINTRLFPWQRDIVRWAGNRGRAALWEDCGLGKTLQELEWGRLVAEHTGGQVLLLCPLAVAAQTKREAEKFEIAAEVVIAKDQSEATGQITITNYERLHLFEPSRFAGVILDESSVLKAYTGATKRQLCEKFAKTPYRLAATATPAPNDRMELGNHSEFLGIMPSDEMLARWFLNDSMKSGGYILRPYAADDFWRWCASWAVCISRPSDLGFPDDGYDLPPLRVVEHVIEPEHAPSGFLFHVGRDISATEVHKEKRENLVERVAKVAELVNGDRDYWAVWCDTDYEADALTEAIPEAVEVRGSHPVQIKEERLEAFSLGQVRVIVTKPEIGGFGLNWQHCCQMTWFAGFSFERWYQALRRLWRFGQIRQVTCHLILTANEQSIKSVVDRKERANCELHREMAARMHDGVMEELYQHRTLREVENRAQCQAPAWLRSRQQAMEVA